jgi:N-acetylglucosamine-6-phosphate deacetylase
MAVATSSVAGVLPGTGLVELTLGGERLVDVSVLSPAAGEGWRELARAEPLLLPGLVDLQVNGYAGVDFNSPDLTTADVRRVVEMLWSEGVTSFCPTVITGARKQMVGCLATLATAAREDEHIGSALVGTHLEGPWISAADGARGAHPVDHVRDPEVADLAAFLASGDIAIITVAPELPGSDRVIRAATAAGVRVSLGHSAADPDDVRRAVAVGATLSTHLGNGVSMTLPRHPNLIWEQLAARRLTAMFIADGHHLDFTTLRAMVRAKGQGRWVLVSDTTSIGGLPAGRYRTHIGSDVELDESGRLGVVGTAYLAGAAVSLRRGLVNALRERIASPRAVVTAVTSRPAQLVGTRAGDRGRLHPGRRADFAIMSLDQTTGDIVAEQTWVRGRRVWSRI